MLSICKTSLNTQIFFNNHPLKSLLCKAIRPQTHMLCVGKKSMHMIGSHLEHLLVESSGGFAFLDHEKELMYEEEALWTASPPVQNA